MQSAKNLWFDDIQDFQKNTATPWRNPIFIESLTMPSKSLDCRKGLCPLSKIRAYALAFTFFFLGLQSICLGQVPELKTEQTLLSELLEKDFLNPTIFQLPDPDHSFRMEDLATPQGKELFTKSTKTAPSFGWTSSQFWFYIPIHSLDYQGEMPLLEIAWPLLDQIDIVLYTDTFEIVKEWRLGDKFPFYQRPIDHTNFVVPLPVSEPGNYLIFLRVASTSSVQLPIRIWNPKAYYEQREYFTTGQGFYYGAMLIMVIYNLFIFLSVRRITYFYYIGFVLGFISIQSSLKGISFQYVWPSYPVLSDFAISFGGTLCLWFVIAFAKSFLNVTKAEKKSYYFLTICQYLIACLACLSLIMPYALYIKIFAVFCVISPLSSIVVGCSKLASGQREARFYVAAWVAIVLGTLLYVGKQIAVLPRNFLTENAMQIGSLLEVVLLSFALADRLNTLKRKLQHVNKKLESHLANVEQQVEEKTRDIRSILKTIRQGIFMIMPENLKIHSDYSQHTTIMLDKKPGLDQTLESLLLDKVKLSNNDRDLMMQTLSASLGHHCLNFEANESCLPKEMVYQSDHGEQFLEIDWDPIINENDEVDRILVSVRDTTEIRGLISQKKRHDEDLQAISEIVGIDSKKFAELMDSSFSLIRACRETLPSNKNENIDTARFIYRQLHTLKGQSRIFGLTGITNIVHDVESELQRHITEHSGFDKNILQERLDGIQKAVDYYNDLDTIKLNRRVESQSKKIIDIHKENEGF